MSTLNPRGARQFTTSDLQAGEGLEAGRIVRGTYTLVNGKNGVQVHGPAFRTPLSASSLAGARNAVDRQMGLDSEAKATAAAAWEADMARSRNLTDGWFKSAR